MNIDKILKELTLEEKASLCSGSDFWHTEEIKRLDIPSIMVLPPLPNPKSYHKLRSGFTLKRSEEHTSELQSPS